MSRPRAIACGALVNALVACIVISVVLFTLGALSGDPFLRQWSSRTFVKFFELVVLWAAPFAVLAGSVGMLWLTRRHSFKENQAAYLAAAACVGAGLGALYPAIWAAIDLGLDLHFTLSASDLSPSLNSPLSLLIMGIVFGAMCAVIVAALFRYRYRSAFASSNCELSTVNFQ